ncbi:MAG: ribonuclease HII [Phycisphaerales bacterium]|nr:ribonuclease HII [Phycisphaerales bacterium]
MIQSYCNRNLLEAGCDEAGRGCYAGPVFAAATILSPEFYHPLLNDSKQVTPKNRLLLRDYIEAHALAFGVAHVSVEDIGKLNILGASIQAMHQAINKLSLTKKPDFIIVDGNQFKPYPNIPHQCIIKGDTKYASIAAASILAKTYRDEYMDKLHDQYPQYHWLKNKGYGTLQHRVAIKQHGLTEHHRKTFNIIPQE